MQFDRPLSVTEQRIKNCEERRKDGYSIGHLGGHINGPKPETPERAFPDPSHNLVTQSARKLVSDEVIAQTKVAKDEVSRPVSKVLATQVAKESTRKSANGSPSPGAKCPKMSTFW